MPTLNKNININFTRYRFNSRFTQIDIFKKSNVRETPVPREYRVRLYFLIKVVTKYLEKESNPSYSRFLKKLKRLSRILKTGRGDDFLLSENFYLVGNTNVYLCSLSKLKEKINDEDLENEIEKEINRVLDISL